MLFGELRVFDHQLEVGILVLRIGLAQADANGTGMLELLRLVEIKLVVVALTLLLQENHFFVCLGDGALEFGARAGQILLSGLDSLTLRVQLCLEFLQLRSIAGAAMGNNRDTR